MPTLLCKHYNYECSLKNGGAQSVSRNYSLPKGWCIFIPRVQPILLTQICIWWNCVSQILSPVIILFKGQCWWFGLKYANYRKPPAREELGAAASSPCHRERGMWGASRQVGQAFPSIPGSERWGETKCWRMRWMPLLYLYSEQPGAVGWKELCGWCTKGGVAASGWALQCFRTKVEKFACGFFFVVCLFL